MEDILVAHPDVNVLLAENDAMALGAMRAINEAGKTDAITIVAIDGQKEAYKLIQDGKMGSTAWALGLSTRSFPWYPIYPSPIISTSIT